MTIMGGQSRSGLGGLQSCVDMAGTSTHTSTGLMTYVLLVLHSTIFDLASTLIAIQHSLRLKHREVQYGETLPLVLNFRQNDVNIKTIHEHKISSVTNEMNLHPNNVNQCSSCEFKTFSKNDLQDHVANTHNTGLANKTNKSAEANSTALAVNSVRNSTKATKNKGKGKRAAHSPAPSSSKVGRKENEPSISGFKPVRTFLAGSKQFNEQSNEATGTNGNTIVTPNIAAQNIQNQPPFSLSPALVQNQTWQAATKSAGKKDAPSSRNVFHKRNLGDSSEETDDYTWKAKMESIQFLNKANLEKNSAGIEKNPQKKEDSSQLKKKLGGGLSMPSEILQGCRSCMDS